MRDSAVYHMGQKTFHVFPCGRETNPSPWAAWSQVAPSQHGPTQMGHTVPRACRGKALVRHTLARSMTASLGGPRRPHQERRPPSRSPPVQTRGAFEGGLNTRSPLPLEVHRGPSKKGPRQAPPPKRGPFGERQAGPELAGSDPARVLFTPSQGILGRFGPIGPLALV